MSATRTKQASLTVKDVVEGITRPNPFSIAAYEAPSNEMLMKKVPFGHSDKTTNQSFIDQVKKSKNWVPGPVYNRAIDWEKEIPVNTGKFKRKPRDTVTDDVFHLSKFREKSNPSPDKYLTDK